MTKALNSVREQYTRRFQRSTAREHSHETSNEHPAKPSEPVANTCLYVHGQKNFETSTRLNTTTKIR